MAEVGVDADEARAVRVRYLGIFRDKIDEPVQNLQRILDQVNPDNDFHTWVYGSYSGTALRAAMNALEQQSRKGLKMDPAVVNDAFRHNVQLGVEKYTQHHDLTQWQRAALQANLDQLRDVVTAEEMLPSRDDSH